jgi:hypothetical protein
VAADSPVYHSLQCHCCGGKIEACTLDDVWAMRIDGVLHQVPVRKVPCHKCLSCDTVTLDGTSDEMIMYCQKKYMAAQGLNTPYLRVRRWIRRRVLGFRDRILRDWYRSMRTFRRETA